MKAAAADDRHEENFPIIHYLSDPSFAATPFALSRHLLKMTTVMYQGCCLSVSGGVWNLYYMYNT